MRQAASESTAIFFSLVRAHDSFRPFIHNHAENIWPGVVAYSVKVELGPWYLAAVQFSEQNCFVFKVGPGKEFAEGIHNTTAAPGDHRLRIVVKTCPVFFGEVTAAV